MYAAPAADLAASMAIDPGPEPVGASVNFTGGVTNNGPDAAQSVVFTITFPSGLTFTSFGTFGGAQAGDFCNNDGAGHVTCHLANLAAGASASLTNGTATANSPGTQTVSNTVSSATADPNSANNTATASTTVRAVAADLAASMAIDPGPEPVGSSVNFTGGVTNNGPDAAQSVVFTITFPSGLTFTSFGTFGGAQAGDFCNNDGAGHVTCHLANLAAGASASLTNGTATANSPGTQTVSNTVSSATADPNSANNTATASTTVVSADQPITMAPQNISATEGASFSGIVATLNDPDTSETGADYTASIDWGDGSAATAGTITRTGPGAFTVSGSHTYVEEGAYTVTVSIADADAPTATARSTANVADAALSASGGSITGTEGASTGTQTVATFTDADPNGTASDYTAIINWGDGQSSSGTVAANNTGAFDVKGSHTYAEEGTYTTMATVTDTPSSIVTATGSATIADAALSPRGASIGGTEGASTGTQTVATFTDADPNGTASDYTASIDWGDGQSSAGTVVPNGAGGFDVKGSHTYSEEGTYSLKVMVTDAGGSIATATGSATIADAALSASGGSITGTEGASTGTQTVATFTDADPNGTASDYTAAINWGDGQSGPGTVAANNTGGFDVKGSHTYAEEGTYTTTVTVTDTPTSVAIATGSATVADAALSSKCAMSSSSVQSYLGPTATFIDQSSTGTLGDFSALISWGDGTSSPGSINGGPGTAPYTVAGSHTFSSTGFFTVTTVIKDVGGSNTTAICQVLVFALAPGGGSFAIGDLENVTGKTVTFWGAQWWKVNPTSTRSKAASFKGFAEAPVSPSCGSAWTTDPGNSTPPPSGPLPDFMGVIVTDSYGQTGSTISGNTVHIVIVRTNPGYRPDPGNAGTGTVIQQAC